MKHMKQMVCALLAVILVAGVCVMPTEARSDNAKVKAFQAAIDNAENGTTVTLTEDLLWGDGEPVEIPAGKDISIDLAGFKMESLETYPVFRVMSGAKVTIKSDNLTSIVKNVEMPEEYEEFFDAETMGLFEVQENAKLTIASGVYDCGANFFTGNTKGEIVLEGGYYNRVPNGTYTVKAGYGFVNVSLNGADMCSLTEINDEEAKNKELLSKEIQKLFLYMSAGKDISSIIDAATEEKIVAASKNGEQITAELVVKQMTSDQVPTADKNAIENKVDVELGTDVTVQYMDVSVVLKADGKEIGKLKQLSRDLIITVSVPDEMQEEGRRYKVVRNVEGETSVLDAALNDDGTITFNTNVSSTCALAYVGKVTVVEDEKTVETVKKETQNVVEEIIAGTVADSVVDEKTAEKVSTAVNSGKTVNAEIVVKKVLQDEVAEKEQSAIEEKVASELGADAKVQYMDVSIVLMADDEELGTLNKLEEEITITVAIPEALRAEGRTYKIIRNHNGVVEVLDTVVNEDGTISFKTDRFSTYALAYTDKVETNTNPNKPSTDIEAPQTGDQNFAMTYIVICLAALVTIFVVKKRSMFVK